MILDLHKDLSTLLEEIPSHMYYLQKELCFRQQLLLEELPFL